METRLHRARRQSDGFGDLADVEAVDVEQFEKSTIVGRKVDDGVANRFDGDVGRRSGRRFFDDRGIGTTSSEIGASSFDDPNHPRRERRRVAQSSKASGHDEPRLLNGVAGVFVSRQEPSSMTKKSRMATSDQSVECFGITVLCGEDEVFVDDAIGTNHGGSPIESRREKVGWRPLSVHEIRRVFFDELRVRWGSR